MKQNYFKITGSHPFAAVHTFLKKELGWNRPGTTGGGGELVSRNVTWHALDLPTYRSYDHA